MRLASLDEQGYFSANLEIKDALGNYRSFLATGSRIENKIAGAFVESESIDSESIIHPYYKTFAEAMPDMAFIANSRGNIIYFNQRWYEFLGGMKNTEGWGWKDRAIHHPGDLQRTILRWKHSLKTGEPYEIEYRLKRHDGEYIWHLGRALPLRDEEGKITLWLGTNTDIHRQKLAEVEKGELNEVLRQRHHALEQVNELHRDLLHLIPHDLRNPLSGMIFSLELLRQEDSFEKRNKLIDHISELIGKQDEIMDGLSAMVEIESLKDLEVEEINLMLLIEEVLEDYSQKSVVGEYDIQIEIDEAESFQHVRIIVRSILANLFSNALKYRSTDRKLKMKLKAVRNSEFVIISLEDNGMGMDLENGTNPFEPFKRLTGKAEGKGVGLYLVKRLIEKNGGKIDVCSTPGEGTRFSCYLKPYD